ncbi:hypothetical protein AX14_004686 [Amanita brunnescens Koide BX004]|nr:hypothetical protein AX14_004686 [Amanita brunnescens Koide BX004]
MAGYHGGTFLISGSTKSGQSPRELDSQRGIHSTSSSRHPAQAAAGARTVNLGGGPLLTLAPSSWPSLMGGNSTWQRQIEAWSSIQQATLWVT